MAVVFKRVGTVPVDTGHDGNRGKCVKSSRE